MEILLIFTVIAATTIPINSVHSKSLADNDIDQILQTIQDLLLQEKSKKSEQDHERLDDDDDDESQYGSLQNNLQDLLRPLSKGDRHRQRPHERVHHVASSNLSPQLLEQLLQDRSHKQRYHKANEKKQHLLPNDLLASLSLNEERNEQVVNSLADHEDDKRSDLGDLSDYSKVYVVLNSDALKKSKNKNKLNNFLSNLLSTSSHNQDSDNRKDKYYKGFLFKGLEARRSKRESKEMSVEEYRPKRSRSERGGGGGGGGGGGRTAIPYIRHRGDIYERGD